MSSQNPAEDIAKAAKAAFEASQLIPPSERVKALYAIRAELETAKEDVLAANRKDLQVLTHRQYSFLSRRPILTSPSAAIDDTPLKRTLRLHNWKSMRAGCRAHC